MRPLHHPAAQDLSLEAVLHALGDPVRLRILYSLEHGGEASCAACVGPALPRSTLSHHFRILREAGLIRQRKHGTALLSTVRREDLDARFPGLLDAVLAAYVPIIPAPAASAQP